MATNFCQLWLTCKNAAEADNIANTLLSKKLSACYGKFASFDGKFWWRGKIENANEVLLEMQSRLDLFDEVEAEVAKLHSYDTFVLQAVPIKKVSKKATTWLDAAIKK